ncbi:hypothetical protein ACIBF1_15820 [Spirillospora sp. NPDC050679]
MTTPRPDHALLAELLDLGDGDDESLLKLALRHQFAPVLEALCTEMLLDLPPLIGRDRLTIQYDIRMPQYVLGFTVEAGGAGARSEMLPWNPEGNPPGDEVDVHLRQSLPEFAALLRAVFGRRAAGDGHRVVSAALAAGCRRGDVDWPGLLERTAARRRDLGGLALDFGTDKWGEHWYARNYQRHFEVLRDRPVRVLEIGVGGFHDPERGGESLQMWKRFFPRAMVYGIDIADKSALDSQRIKTFQGNQADREFLESVVRETGPLDIVLDDGSHFCADQIATFQILARHVRPGGFYAIEDLHTSYWPGFGGSSTDLSSPATTTGFLKSLVDGLNHEDLMPGTAYRRRETDRAIVGVHFFHSLAIMEMGLNAEGDLSSFIPDEVKRRGPQVLVPDYPVPEGFTADGPDERAEPAEPAAERVAD